MERRSDFSRGAASALFVALAVGFALTLATAAIARASAVEVALDDSRGSCGVRGAFTVDVPRDVAWAVLTDYEAIPRFVHTMRASRLERDSTGRVLLRQEAVSGAWFVHRRMRVLLELHETRLDSIGFRDVSGADFRAYAGEWRIASGPGDVRVEYRLQAEPKDFLARTLCHGPLRRTARELLEEVRAEMVRRAGGSAR